MQEMTPSDYAAWYGAGLATLVLVWDIFKWRNEGPKIFGKTNPDMLYIDSDGNQDKKQYLHVELVNRGTETTTISSFCMEHYSNILCALIGKKKSSHFVPKPLGAQLPYEIGPGGRWTGSVTQDESLEKLLKSGLLYVSMFHTWSDKPVRIRVKRKVKKDG